MHTTHAILRLPAESLAQGITTASLGAPDFAKACAQHRAYRAALEAAGVAVTVLDADAGHPDAHFVEDTAVVIGGRAVLARPGAPSRRGEVMREPLAAFFDAMDAIEAPGTLDGGDVCEAGDSVYVGISQRTNRAGAEQLARFVARFGKACVPIDIRRLPGMLHLKSGLAYLGEDCFVAVEALAPSIGARDARFVYVAPDEAYAANCIRVNGVVLIAAGYPQLEKQLEQAGFSTVVLDVSEFRKMDGGLSCLSLRF